MRLGQQKDISDFKSQPEVAKALRELSNAVGHIRQLLLGEKSRLGMRVYGWRSGRVFVGGLLLRQTMTAGGPAASVMLFLQKRMDKARGGGALVCRSPGAHN